MDDEIDFSDIISFERSYDFLPYTPATIKNYLKQVGFELEWVRMVCQSEFLLQKVPERIVKKLST